MKQMENGCKKPLAEAYVIVVKNEKVTIWFDSVLIVPTKQIETNESHFLMPKTSKAVVTARI